MSQKSSLPQVIQSVSEALMPDSQINSAGYPKVAVPTFSTPWGARHQNIVRWIKNAIDSYRHSVASCLGSRRSQALASMTLEQQVRFLFRERFPDLRDPRTKGIVPNNSAAARAYESELRAMGRDEIKRLVKEVFQMSMDRIDTERAAADEERFFNFPPSTADFLHWGKLPYWSEDETVALTLGKAPEAVHWEALKGLSTISPFAMEYERRLDFLKRAVRSGQLTSPIVPPAFIEWAQRMDVEIHPELVETVKKYLPVQLDWPSRFEAELKAHKQTRRELEALRIRLKKLNSNPLNLRERESLLKIVIGMAIEDRGFDPSAQRSPIPREIADVLLRQGIGLSEDTIRKFLQEGKDLLPRQADNPNRTE